MLASAVREAHPRAPVTYPGVRGFAMPGRYHEHMRLLDAPLAVLAAARLSRLAITDDIGRWWLKEPVDRAMDRYAEREMWTAAHEGRDPAEPWWWKYRSGLDCGYCLGFWVAVLVLVTYAVLPRRVWRAVMAPFALNYIAAHLGEALGDYASDEEEA